MPSRALLGETPHEGDDAENRLRVARSGHVPRVPRRPRSAPEEHDDRHRAQVPAPTGAPRPASLAAWTPTRCARRVPRQLGVRRGVRGRGRRARRRPRPGPPRSAACPIHPGGGAALRLLAAAPGRQARGGDRHRARASRASGCCAACAADGVLTSRRHRGRAPAPRPRGRSSPRASPPRAPGSSPAARSRCCPGWPTPPTTSSSSTAPRTEYAEYVEEAARLLRPGGVHGDRQRLWHDKVADPAQRDPDTIAIRGVASRALHEDERLLVGAAPGRRRPARPP